VLYAHTSRVFHLESNPGNARAMVQAHGEGPGRRDVWLNPPPIPLTTPEMDFVYGLPYARAPHPAYGNARIPAWDMIKFSINIMRGCFGGCTFCSITEHEGRIIQSRSEESILHEIEEIRDRMPDFKGHISDMGGPTANMYRMACKDEKIERACRRLSCVYPGICENLNTDHAPLISLYRKARAIPGVKRVTIGSGLRYDLAVRSPEYVKELVTHHVSGLLKIAPEHTEEGTLSKMMKPGIGSYEAFRKLFDKYSAEAGKKQHLVPYFIAAHPGSTDEDMLNLALWLKANGFRPDQVQTFMPTPMAMATAMYHSRKNPLRKVTADSETVETARAGKTRKFHKALLRWHGRAAPTSSATALSSSCRTTSRWAPARWPRPRRAGRMRKNRPVLRKASPRPVRTVRAAAVRATAHAARVERHTGRVNDPGRQKITPASRGAGVRGTTFADGKTCDSQHRRPIKEEEEIGRRFGVG
jgi:uncharacterized radical SAM protein YgiQ